MASEGETLLFDRVGRLVAILFYVLPALWYVTYRHAPAAYVFLVGEFLLLVVVLAAVSSALRIRSCLLLLSRRAQA